MSFTFSGAGVRAALACALAALVAPACSARSNVGEDGGPGGGAPPLGTGGSSATGDDVGVAPLACGAGLTVTSPAEVDVTGGAPSRVAAVFGTNNGEVVSLLHGWSPPPDASSTGVTELHASTLEPWREWPPAPGEHFVVDAAGGASFTGANVAYGQLALAFQHQDPANGDGLYFSPAISATSPTGLLLFELATHDEQPSAVAVVPGYDTPPIAFNVGYLASLVTWDARDPKTHVHALRSAIGASTWALGFGLVQRPDQPDLACADAPIAADAVRVGNKWWVVAGSGSALASCADADAGPPSALVLDELAWGAPDAIDWSLERLTSTPGDAPIVSVHAVAALDGAWALVGRKGQASLELVRFEPDGTAKAPLPVPEEPASDVLDATLVNLRDGLLVARVETEAPTTIALELRDREGVIRDRGSIPASGPIASLSLLQAKDEGAVLVAWTTAESEPGGARLEIARVGCEESP